MELPDIERALPRRLRAARALAGLKVAEVADKCGWTPAKQYLFESGSQVPSAIELAALAKVTGQPVSYFIAEEAAA
jgi:transcriptional regulator with XRE-family HTH domain